MIPDEMKTSVIITRAEYMAALPRFGTPESIAHHRRYYAQFVTESTKELVRRYIGEDRIRASKDPHFNDIPLAEWDGLSTGGIPRAISFKDGGDFPSLAGENCIAKEAAQQIRES